MCGATLRGAESLTAGARRQAGVAEELYQHWLPRVCKNKDGNGDRSGAIDEEEVSVISASPVFRVALLRRTR